MEKWEHGAFILDLGDDEIKHANLLGDEGWELVQFLELSEFHAPTLIMKRKISDSPVEQPAQTAFSSGKLRKNLESKGFTETLITQVFDTLAELGIVKTAPEAGTTAPRDGSRYREGNLHPED